MRNRRWLTLSEMQPGLNEAMLRNLSPSGTVFRAACAEGQRDSWAKRRAARIQQHLDAAEKAGEAWWVDGVPSDRHLRLIGWAYSPTRARYLRWAEKEKNRPSSSSLSARDKMVSDKASKKWNQKLKKRLRYTPKSDPRVTSSAQIREVIEGVLGMPPEALPPIYIERPAPVIRIGLPETSGAFGIAAEILMGDDAPVLISASRLWQHAEGRKPGRFRAPGDALDMLDVALDSAGFTVMKQWCGIFPWKTRDYVDLALSHSFAWYSQPDLCCEKDVAADQAAVKARVRKSAELLAEARQAAVDIADIKAAEAALLTGDLSEYARKRKHADILRYPMPVIQGWTPDNYEASIEAIDKVIGGDWPAMVGIGSVCARNVHGDDGIIAIIRHINDLLPPKVKLHLFGVKGAVLPHLHPWLDRIGSIDSVAWDMAARREENTEDLKPILWRIEKMVRFWLEQRIRVAALMRTAHVEDLVGRTIAQILANPPAGVTPEFMRMYVATRKKALIDKAGQEYDRQLRGVLAA